MNATINASVMVAETTMISARVKVVKINTPFFNRMRTVNETSTILRSLTRLSNVSLSAVPANFNFVYEGGLTTAA